MVIFDFDSPDIDLEQALKKSSLKNYHFISKPGNYSRVLSFSEAIKLIKDPNAIVVTIDLHLDIGSQLINDIRKVGTKLLFQRNHMSMSNKSSHYVDLCCVDNLTPRCDFSSTKLSASH